MQPKLIYLDACVLIFWLEDNDRHMAVLEALFDQARNEQVRLVSSAITIGEVVYVQSEKDARTRDPAVLAKIDSLWHPNQVRIVEVNGAIMMEARDIRWTAIEENRQVPHLPDAIHMASAKYAGVDNLFTYNVDHFAPSQHLFEFEISEPTVEQPALSAPTDTEGSQL